MNPKLKTTKEQGVGVAPRLATLRRVEQRVGAPEWDYEELTSFNYSHEPTQKPTQGG